MSKKASEVSFARPPYANELMTDEAKKKFDELPGWQRHLMKRLIEHGNLAQAAKEAGVSTHVGKVVDLELASQKTVKEALSAGGIEADDIVTHLKDCLVAHGIRFDKHGKAVEFTDLNLKLKTIELICKLRGDLNPKGKEGEKSKDAVDLFPDTDIE